jgi:predicted acylesterase/phospholipase RssA
MSVPLLWTPVKFENKLFVDGGLIDNFPINMFTNNKSSKVLGIHLNTKKSTIDSVNNLEEYLISVILCGLEGLTYNACRGYEDNVIMIDIKDVDITNFDINENKINEMYNIGYNAILNRYDKK